MKLTYEEIQEIIESEDLKRISMRPSDWFNENVYDLDYLIEIRNPQHADRAYNPFKYIHEDELELAIELVQKLGNYEVKTQVGDEGQGDDYYIVYYFVDHDVYIKFDGWYASYQGSEYSNMYQVWPHDVVRTEYLDTPN